MFLCPIDSVRFFQEEILEKFFSSNIHGWNGEISRIFSDQFSGDASNAMQIGLSSIKLQSVPRRMTWTAAEEYLKNTSNDRQVMLIPWGYDEWKCVMLCGDESVASNLGLEVASLSERPIACSPVFDQIISSVGGWKAPSKILLRKLSTTDATVRLTTVSSHLEVVNDIVGSIREASVNKPAITFWTAPGEIEIVSLDDVPISAVNEIFSEAQTDSQFRFAVSPSFQTATYAADVVQQLLLIDSNDFVASGLLKRMRWVITANCYGDSPFQFVVHTRPGCPESGSLLREVGKSFGTEECIVW